METLCRPRITPAWSSLSSSARLSSSSLLPRPAFRARRAASRLLISALINANGAQTVSAHARPMTPTRTVAAVAVVMKKVENMQAANKRWESSQARRSVSHGIWQAERRRERRECDSSEGTGGKKLDMEVDIPPGVIGVRGVRGLDGRMCSGCASEGSGCGGRYVGTMIRGRSMFEENDVIAKIKSANVPIRVAFSQALSIWSSERSGFASKYGLTSSWPI